MRPSRLAVMVGAARRFIRRFFDLNPLGQLGLAVLRNGVAEKLTELSGSPEAQVARLAAYGVDTGGDASLQNGLELGRELMSGVPPYGQREVVLLMAALASVDPGRVEDSIAAAAADHIRVSVVGVCAEVHILRRAAQLTGGSYGVALSEAHLGELLLAHAPPPPAPPGSLTAELVRMGFPARGPGDPASAAFVGELPVLAAGGFTCPRCRARTQELPCKCHVCGLPLISSPHLARSYHHLFPVPPFEELDAAERAQLAAAAAAANGHAADGGGTTNGDAGGAPPPRGSALAPPWFEPGGVEGQGGGGLFCFGCLKLLAGPDGGPPAGADGTAGALVLRCGQCAALFCYDCDAYVHETLHNCPGCECAAGAAAAPDAPAAANGLGG
ncbi:GTF2H2 [Scenedesmus sp. PABB004]|nr:GTF2H2 [Scenedesmus sp. PABB004]